MTLEIAFLLALLAGMVYLFLTEKLAVDLTAFLGLTVLVFGGYLEPTEAFSGFSSPAVITMLSVFIVGAALLETGVADVIGGRIHRIVGSSEVRLIVVLMLVAGILSAFMNNIAATAVLMPAVASIAPRAGLAPSRLFMPLAFGAILGGTTTLVGTPPNILAGQMLAESGLEPFELFDFTPIGAAILAVGVIFMVTVGRKLLPRREDRGATVGEAGGLSQVYQLQQRLFSLRIPTDSPLSGQSLAATRLGNTLGIKVLTILRGGKTLLAPDPSALLAGGDVLFVSGDRADLERLLHLQSLEVQEAEAAEVPPPLPGVGGARLALATDSRLAGRSLRELGVRQRYGIVVIGLRRGGALLRTHLAEAVLEHGDELLVLGREADLGALASSPDVEVLELGLAAVQALGDRLFTIRLPTSSPLVGATVAGSRLSELAGLTVAGLVREGRTILALQPDEVLAAGDRLLVATEPETILSLVELGDVQLEPAPAEAPIESEDVGMVEVAVAPRSTVVGKTLAELGFRERYGLLALALWREGQPVHVDFARTTLSFGDAMLLHGPRESIRRLAADPDFVVLSQADQAPRRTRKAKYAFACLLLMVGLVVAGLQPIHVAAFAAASLAILAGTLSMQEAYRAIEWRAIFLVAAVLPVGIAMERTGAAGLIAGTISQIAGPVGPYATLGALVVLASLLSQGLDGAPAVVLLAPVVIQTAEELGTSPYPMMMGVGLAASAAFMTPFSHKANLLVMGAGGYRSSDYLKVGTPLTVVLLVLMVLMIPIFFPF